MYDGLIPMTVTFIATALICLVIAEGNPVPVIRKAIYEKIFVFHILPMLGIIGINLGELRLEQVLGGIVHWDMTPYIYQWEGGITGLIQETFRNSLVTNITAYFYVFVFPVLVWVAMAVYNKYTDRVMMKKLLVMFLLNYLIALPFYLFFPVNETWFYHKETRFLLGDVYTAFESQYRHLSGLDNCFPSLHTSLSASLALLAVHSGYKRLAWLTTLSAVVVVFSTVYLGIHWLTDLSAGLVAGVLAVNLAIVFVDGPVRVYTRFRKSIGVFLAGRI